MRPKAHDGETGGWDTAREWASALALMHALPSAIVALDAEGRVTTLNPAAERLFATSEEDARGRPYPEVVGPSLSDRILSLFLHVARSRDSATPRVVEATLPNGRRARLHANLGPLCDEAGRPTGFVLAAEDHTAEAEARQQEAAKAERLRHTLESYLGETVASAVGERPSLTRLGGVRQPLSVLHADIRGYTTLAEALPPEQVMELLLRYHGAAVAALEAEGGTMDRYIGDAVLALWNAPRAQQEHARMALRGALTFQRATREIGTDLSYGVGVHTGDAVVGNLGSERYMHYTAVGDTVNVAARLQAEAPAGQVICSAATLAAAGPGISVEPLGDLVVKGRQHPVEAYRVESIEP